MNGVYGDKNTAAVMVEQTKLAAFFLWEYTGHQNTIALWYCAEDMASFLDRCRMYLPENLTAVLRLSRNDREYKALIRHLAYRIHLYTGIHDDGFNWYSAEKLLNNIEWRDAILFMSNHLKKLRDNGGREQDYKILSPVVKSYYVKN